MSENLYLPPTEAEIERAIAGSAPEIAVTIKRLVNDRQRLLHDSNSSPQSEGDHRHQLDFQFARGMHGNGSNVLGSFSE